MTFVYAFRLFGCLNGTLKDLLPCIPIIWMPQRYTTRRSVMYASTFRLFGCLSGTPQDDLLCMPLLSDYLLMIAALLTTKFAGSSRGRLAVSLFMRPATWT